MRSAQNGSRPDKVRTQCRAVQFDAFYKKYSTPRFLEAAKLTHLPTTKPHQRLRGC